MALIKCPECGKDNISDTAPACPQCGFAIKEYFEKIEQEKKAVEQREKRKEDAKKWLDQRLAEIDKSPRPAKPVMSDIIMQNNGIIGIVSGIIAAFGAILLIFGLISGDIKLVISPLLFGGVCGIVAFVVLKDGKGRYEVALSRYENWESVKENDKEIVLLRYRQWLDDIEKSAKQPTPPPQIVQPQQSYGLKCPVCGSVRVKRISTLSRVVSVDMVGLASSKIGKQYECLKCKHKW